MNFIGSILAVEDIKRSRKFYEEILQQTVKYDFGLNITFEGRFAIISKDHFYNITKNIHSRNQIADRNLILYFETESIDDVFTNLRQNNIEFIHEIEEQPWAQRVFRCYDPDKYIVEIGEKVESTIIRLHKRQMPVDDIAKQTSISVDYIKTVINSKSQL
ncbi:MAG TPA: VOC family protein [Spirochaetota bacterium]|nr:VOC family protein [Spirochaetota bacterium]